MFFGVWRLPPPAPAPAPPYPLPAIRYPPDPVDQPPHLLLRRVARTTRAHDARHRRAELAHGGERVEVAVAEEEAFVREPAHDLLVVDAVDRERERRRAFQRRRRTVERDATDRRKPGPERIREAQAVDVERVDAGRRRGARRTSAPGARAASPRRRRSKRGSRSPRRCRRSPPDSASPSRR